MASHKSLASLLLIVWESINEPIPADRQGIPNNFRMYSDLEIAYDLVGEFVEIYHKIVDISSSNQLIGRELNKKDIDDT